MPPEIAAGARPAQSEPARREPADGTAGGPRHAAPTHAAAEPGRAAGDGRLADITLVGCGLRALDHLTREADRCLREARVVFHSIYSRELAADLAQRNPQAVLLAQEDGEYLVGQYRPDMYRRIADRVLAEAARGPGVVVLHPGSVLVVDAIARRLIAEGAARGLSVAVLPGVSAVEYVLAEMGWDLAGGLQVILAQNLVLYRRSLDPTQAAIVIQPGYYDTRWFAGAPLSQAGRFEALHRRLAASHPPQAPMALVLAPVAAHEAAQVLWFRRERLPELGDAITPFHTLFVPPVGSPEADPGFARRIESWDELLAHTLRDDYALPRQADPRCWFAGPPQGLADAVIAESAALAGAWPHRRAELLGDAR